MRLSSLIHHRGCHISRGHAMRASLANNARRASRGPRGPEGIRVANLSTPIRVDNANLLGRPNVDTIGLTVTGEVRPRRAARDIAARLILWNEAHTAHIAPIL